MKILTIEEHFTNAAIGRLATLPIPDPSSAAKELERDVKTLGFKGENDEGCGAERKQRLI
jgi:hypothetical protein